WSLYALLARTSVNAFRGGAASPAGVAARGGARTSVVIVLVAVEERDLVVGDSRGQAVERDRPAQHADQPIGVAAGEVAPGEHARDGQPVPMGDLAEEPHHVLGGAGG